MVNPKKPSEPMEPEAYVVEKILEKRIRGTKIEYFLKWEGYPEEDNSWEPKQNINKFLIAEFEKREKNSESQDADDVKPETLPKLRASCTKAARVTTGPKIANRKKAVPAIEGFARGLEPERIIGATDVYGELKFLMKWVNREEADLVPSSEANVKCPAVVIRFYEDRLVWKNSGEDAKK